MRLLADQRVLQVLGQVAFVLLATAIFWYLGSTASTQLRDKGLVTSFGFLELRAGFAISESPDWYSGDSTYGQAFAVGMTNTLRIVFIGLALTTLLGLFVGVFLLSSNWLIRNIARAYVDFLRNTPLLVQIFTWYYIVMFSLPLIRDAITIPNEGVDYISLRLALWALLGLALWRYLSGPAPDLARRELLRYGFVALLLVSEFAAWGHYQPGAQLWSWGAGLTSAFLVYAVLSLALAYAAHRALPSRWRPRAVGLILGQALAGLIFTLGLLPLASLRVELTPSIYISIRGFVFPQVLATGRFAAWFAYVGLGALLAGFTWLWLARRTEATGQPYARGPLALLAMLVTALLGWVLVGLAPAPAHVAVASGGEVALQPLAEAPGARPARHRRTASHQHAAALATIADAEPLRPLSDRPGNYTGIYGPAAGAGDLHLGLHCRNCARRHSGGAPRADGGRARDRPHAGAITATYRLPAGHARHHPAPR